MMWTEEQANLATQRWQEGRSATEIAGEIGGITRSAVIGKLGRLGLLGMRRPKVLHQRRPRRPKFRRLTRTTADSINRILAKRQYVPPPEPPKPPTCEPVKLLAESFTGKTDRHCKFIIGPTAGDETLFCGERPAVFTCDDGEKKHSSFCEFHHAIVWVKPPPRKRNRTSNSMPVREAA